jgi:hypothetical protein
MSASGILQAATVISKTNQVAIGGEIPTENAWYLTVFIDYVKGDESGVTVRAFAKRTTGGTAYQTRVWTEASGVQTADLETIPLTASGSYAFRIMLGAIDYLALTQAGTNDGTPTGTLAVSYTLSQ